VASTFAVFTYNRRVNPINLLELEEQARAVLDEGAFDYMAGGAQDEITLRANQSAWDRVALRNRVLVDVSEIDLTATVLSHRVSLPVMLAPVAFQGIAHEEAEIATARAAGTAGAIMVLSTFSNAAVEKVVEAATAPVWFQIYIQKDRAAAAKLVQRAAGAGCEAIVLTVDTPRPGRRERDMRRQFKPPEDLLLGNLLPKGLKRLPRSMVGRDLSSGVDHMLDPSVSWKDLAWLRSLTDLPLVLKGVMRADDAARAAEEGVEAIIVSNHGGRQLDTAPATVDVLQEVVGAVDGRCEVHVDGGVRRGTDVVKALAMGATSVLIGRPFIWGLALDGEAGVAKVLEILRDELELAMALCGCSEIAAIDRDLLA
jgi:4-hydroxymandelate oxidase